MACGTPVVCSNTSSLPEVVGDAALTVSPTDTNEIGDALIQVLGDQRLRSELVERGYARAARFTWESSARSLLSCFERTASLPTGRRR